MAIVSRTPTVFSKHWPFWAGAVVALGNVAWLLARQIAGAGGQLVYPSDDAYLRLAVARNLATHATWGLNPGQFASVVGSLSWPFLNAVLDLILGTRTWIPLAVNIGLCLLLIGLCYRILGKFSTVGWFKALSLIVLVLVLPLAPLVTGGLEHVLQLLLCLLFADRLMDHLSVPRRGDAAVLIVLGAGLSVTRYEGLLLVLVGCLILAARREFRLGLAVGALAALPVILYGLLSMRHGWLPVPNTVYFRRAPLFPGTWRERFAVLTRFFDVLDQAPDLRAIVLVPTLALVWRSARGSVRSLWDREFLGVVLFLLTAVLHFILIGNPSDRYSAYVVLLGWWASLPLLGAIVKEAEFGWGARQVVPEAITFLLGLVLVLPLLNRGITENLKTPQAARNMYEQELQASLLLRSCSPGQAVAADKVGLLAYQGNRVLDLSGFGTIAVARARRAGSLNSDLVQRLAQQAGVQLAIINAPGLKSAVPATWQEIEVWTIHDCIACAETGVGGISSDYLDLFATSSEAQSLLHPCLASFSATLPTSVIQSAGK